MIKKLLLIIIFTILIIGGYLIVKNQSKKGQNVIILNRHEKIPSSASKMTPDQDKMPPILHSQEFEKPIPMPGKINTAGGEDSSFIPDDGSAFYFFFTPIL